MDDKRLAHIEYESLYKEIDKHSDRLYLIISFDILAVTTLLGLVPSLTPEVIHAFGSEFSTRSLFFLLPLVILLPSFVLVAAALNSTARIAAYIHVFYEKRTSGISWQHAMQCMREIDQKAERFQYLGQSLRLLVKKEKKGEPTRFLGKGLSLLLTALATLCIVLSAVAGIDRIVESKNVSSLPYMLVIWTIACWCVVVCEIGLGRTWKWSNIQNYIDLLDAKLRPASTTEPHAE